MLFVSIVLFILSILVFCWILYRVITTKKFKFKDVIYTIGVFITYYFLLVMLKANYSETPLVHIFLESVKDAIKFVGMDFDSEIYALTKLEQTILPSMTYIILCIDSVFGFMAIIFVLFKVALINKIRFFKARHCFNSENKVVDSIFSFNDLTKKYLSNLSAKDKKHTVVFINKFKDGFTKEQIKEVKSFLYASKIAYKEATINELAFRKCATNHENNIISFFTENNEILSFTKEAKKYIDNHILVFNLYDTDGSKNNDKYVRFNYYDSVDINGKTVKTETKEFAKLLKFLFDNKIPFYINMYHPKDGEDIKFIGTDVSKMDKEGKTPTTNEICIKSFNDIDRLIDNNLINIKARKNIHFIISTNREQNHFLKPILSETHGYIRSFDKYELCALKFVQENNLAKYIRKADPEIINENLTIKDCDINLFFFGFGSMNKSLFEKLLITTQFVEEKDNKLVPKRMNVHVYDGNSSLDSLLLSTGLLNYSKNDFEPIKDQYFDLPEDYRNIDFNFKVNLNSQDVLKSVLKNIKKDKKQFNFFIVSLGDDFANTSFADKLDKVLVTDEQNKNFIFLNTKVNLDVCSLTNNKNYRNNTIVSFGLLNDLLARDNIVLEKFISCCKKRHYFYTGGKKFEENEFTNSICKQNWSQLSYIKQYSNVSSIAGLSFKLSLLGFDDYDFDIVDFNKKYFGSKTKPTLLYDDLTKYGLTDGKNKYTARDVLAFMEHERWNALELSQGVLPLAKDRIIELNGSSKTKDESLHANLCSSKGLIEYYEFMHENASKIDGYTLINKDGSDNSEVFKYDYQLMDDMENYQNYLRN